jgi:hypothetical protein
MVANMAPKTETAETPTRNPLPGVSSGLEVEAGALVPLPLPELDGLAVVDRRDEAAVDLEAVAEDPAADEDEEDLDDEATDVGTGVVAGWPLKSSALT